MIKNKINDYLENGETPTECIERLRNYIKVLDAEASSLSAEIERLRANKWLPMETAPKDGTRIILDWGGSVRVGFYLDNIACQVPWQGWRVPSMEAYPRNESPKYWMPMPDAVMEGE